MTMKPYFINNANNAKRSNRTAQKQTKTHNHTTSKKNFMTLISKSYLDEFIKTDNGANAYSTIGNKLVDFNFASSSFRDIVVNNKDKENIWLKFKDCLNDDIVHSLEYLLYIRDIESGLGERDTFRYLLFNTILETGIVELLNIPLADYGRWDDYVELYFMASSALSVYYPDKTCNTKNKPIPRDRKFYILNRIKETILNIIKTQLKEDYDKVISFNKKSSSDSKPSISLLAKWLPSVKTSSEKSVIRAKKLCKALGLTEKKYRLRLSTIRKYLNVVEVKMSSNKWKYINYELVPSKANMLYSSAFLTHDRDRREKFLKNVACGKSELKTSTLYPYEIIKKADNHIYENEDLELIWSNYIKESKFNLDNTIVVRDGSGSMESYILNNKVSCLDIANSITLLASNYCKGDFHNKFITFSSTPELVDLSNQKSLKEKLKYMNRYDDCTNTNIKSVFDLLLKIALKNNVKNSDLPKNILIVSDMEFDHVTDCRSFFTNNYTNKTPIEEIKSKFNEHGYDLPKLIFWNVESTTNIKVPIKENKNGVILVSGFSKSIFEIVTSNELDPVKALFNVLEKERFSIPVLNILEKCKNNYGRYTIINTKENKKRISNNKRKSRQNNNRIKIQNKNKKNK